jgi:ankyrin repeat protein
MYDHEAMQEAVILELFKAAHQGDISIFNFLFKYATDEQKQEIVNTPFNGLGLLQFAVGENQEAIVSYLLSIPGIDIDRQTYEGLTALIKAVAIRNQKLVTLLLAAGADPNIQDRLGVTALMLAALYNYPLIVSDLIAHGADLTLENQAGMTALSLAARRGHLDIVQQLLDFMDINSNEVIDAFFVALKEGHRLILKEFLVDRELDVNDIIDEGHSPLWIALNSQIPNREEIIALLLEYGARE